MFASFFELRDICDVSVRGKVGFESLAQIDMMIWCASSRNGNEVGFKL